MRSVFCVALAAAITLTINPVRSIAQMPDWGMICLTKEQIISLIERRDGRSTGELLRELNSAGPDHVCGNRWFTVETESEVGSASGPSGLWIILEMKVNWVASMDGTKHVDFNPSETFFSAKPAAGS
jgi:hypothetical protein